MRASCHQLPEAPPPPKLPPPPEKPPDEPLDEDEKNVPFGEAASGASGLETLLPLTLKWAEGASVKVPFALQKISSDPARLLGIAGGRLEVGAPADVIVFDPTAFRAIAADTLMSQGKNTPWLRRELQGRVIHTLVDGKIVFSA